MNVKIQKSVVAEILALLVTICLGHISVLVHRASTSIPIHSHALVYLPPPPPFSFSIFVLFTLCRHWWMYKYHHMWWWGSERYLRQHPWVIYMLVSVGIQLQPPKSHMLWYALSPTQNVDMSNLRLLDVDECENVTICGTGAPSATCDNTPGSYMCSCPSGYNYNSLTLACDGMLYTTSLSSFFSYVILS